MSFETIDYYNRHAAEYAEETVNVDIAALYAEFLPMVKPGGHILDAGCGSGRDAGYFKQQGFTVSAFDASAAMAKIASERLHQTVAVHSFEQLDKKETFDGIWCCASLLHVADKALPDVFSRLQRALKPNAVLYASFKYGDGERSKDGRNFTDMNEPKLAKLVADIAGLTLSKTWLTQDKRPQRSDEMWFNALLKKDAV
ncbi:bifunctional 2-polyprenyl-6-hydroxyphenol methylase/3-demethylubiquinol 3-O-methyltransferase UbiG [Rheinheimera sp.]|uniref:class I SAM-dependent methyltransferase n=1 Tax=Rheinheimera sp. TaxID=1869214 RepID=UPI00273232F0|nr:class I SAM-dependent methyltransferase [Rheinheimera sp.]MDP2716712.1 class I SAM-dependent methyltransferase [Rheinheimera sp.]